MELTYKTILILVTSMISHFSYSQEGATYTTSTTGTLNGINFTITNINNLSDPYTADYDLSVADYSSSPLSDQQACITFIADNDWTITFDSPIDNLLLYCRAWRTSETTFNHPFTILSSTGLQNPNGNVLASTSYADGIIQFSSSITSLSVTIDQLTTNGLVAMTFGVNPTLSSQNFDISTESIKVIPNPSDDFIELSNNTTAETYTIFDMQGTKITSSNITGSNQINIQQLTPGIYFLKLDNGNTLKFIKE